MVSPNFSDLSRTGEIWGPTLKTFPSFPSCYYILEDILACSTRNVHPSLSSVILSPTTREAVSKCLLVSPKPCCASWRVPCCASRFFKPLKLDWWTHGYCCWSHLQYSFLYVLCLPSICCTYSFPWKHSSYLWMTHWKLYDVHVLMLYIYTDIHGIVLIFVIHTYIYIHVHLFIQVFIE